MFVAVLAAAFLPTFVDDVSIGDFAIPRAGVPPLVCVEPLARALGVRIVRRGDDVVFSRGDDEIVLAVDSRSMREDGDDALALVEPLRDRHGTLLLTARDVARVLGVRERVERARVAFVRPVRLATQTHVVEIAATPAPTAVPTPRARATTSTSHAHRLARIAFGLDRSDGRSALRLDMSGATAAWRTDLSAYGIDGFGSPRASLAFGTAERGLDVGELVDPLATLVLQPTPATGFAWHRGPGGIGTFAFHRADDGRTIAGIALHETRDRIENVALVTRRGRLENLVYRDVAFRRFTAGTQTFETFASARGLALASAYRTSGRTFVDIGTTVKIGTLPGLEPTAPLHVAIGRRVGNATTAAFGLASATRGPLRPTIALATDAAALQATLAIAARTPSASLTYRHDGLSLAGFATFGRGAMQDLDARYAFGRTYLDATFARDEGGSTATVVLHTDRPGTNAFAGIGTERGGIAPIVGLALPLGGDVAIETSWRPSGGRRPTFHAGLAFGIAAHARASVPSGRVAVRVGGDLGSRPWMLVVDGSPQRRYDGPSAVASLPVGDHTLSVASVAGDTASDDVDVRIERSGTAAVALDAWRVRTIAGRVVTDGTLASETQLGGLIVVARPSGVETRTNDDGSFAFVRAAFAPGTTVDVEASSLPPTLRGLGAMPIDAGEPVLTLGPSLPIERRVFPPATAAR